MPRVPTHTFSMHGGAGAILSVGLMKRIPFDWFEDCVTTTYTTGGDAMISICLWEVRPLPLQRLGEMLTCVLVADTGSAPCVGQNAVTQ
jgi:hypothetical protein